MPCADDFTCTIGCFQQLMCGVCVAGFCQCMPLDPCGLELDGGIPDLDGGIPDLDGGFPDLDGAIPDLDGAIPDGSPPDPDDGGAPDANP